MGYTAPHHATANGQYIAYFCGKIFGVETVAHNQILFIPKGKENIAGVKKIPHTSINWPSCTCVIQEYHSIP